jgi:uncharacterized tellurite resistance protein B-like protein
MATAKLNREGRLKLIRFVCAMAWADLDVNEQERAHVLKVMERLGIDAPEDRQEVMRLLKSPPPADDLDPYEIPRALRVLFVKECEDMIRADGVIHPDEADAIVLLKKILFGEKEQ